MAKLDPKIVSHLEWLGFVRPTGLVVSAPVLVRAGAILDERDSEGQRLVRASTEPSEARHNRVSDVTLRYDIGRDTDARITDFATFARFVLGWGFSSKGYAGTTESPIPPELEVSLPEAGETLRPDYAVRELEPQSGAPAWQLLVRTVGPEEDFEAETRAGGRLELSAHSRMERLLRRTGVPAGLLVNGYALRLISAPRGESSGWLDFRIADMIQTAGRPIVSALRMLLSEQRLLALPRHQRLAALLADSRRFQNEVSEKLAAQVLHALYELLRGFQAANEGSKGELLREVLAEKSDNVYRALLTVILRLVFLLYAEERNMLPESDTFLRYYSLAGLHERLREDAALYPDTMDQRFGAWAQLLALFRMVHDGAAGAGMHLPARHGALFDPDRFSFLEGRAAGSARQIHERISPPLVPDGTVYRALEKLLILDGERISYRALDVEQIGSVYETMMGFRLEAATGRSLAIKSQKKQGAPTAVDLDALLAEPAANRVKWLEERTARKLTDTVKKLVLMAETLEDLHAALLPVADQAATPDLVAQGAMVLQPSEERRRSGSHYTPRELTEPIVRTTLDPILSRLHGKDGKPPRPEAILNLKVCDPAMGSGAFLVEACRYLGDALVEAWEAHDGRPIIPSDEDQVVFARRLVAQRCLYGVDRNPVAVDLAKMSLWLATLAKDHALTFLDHALHHGDSLVGLSRRQIEAFHWNADAPCFQAGFEAVKAREHLANVTELRREIRDARDSVSDRRLRELWEQTQLELGKVRLLGDLTLTAWFEAEKPKERESKRMEFANGVVRGDADGWRGWLQERRHGDPPFAPFHWEIELPEVFERENPGFDAFIGNPPFAGKNSVASGNLSRYADWLKDLHPESHGNADLVAHFFRRAFDLLRRGGTFGLIATNTIAQGDTRASGLRWICTHGGEIFAARKRLKWPGLAAVVVSVVHIMKGPFAGPKQLDDHEVATITAFLFHRGGHEDPLRLAANASKSFVGSYVLGVGFTFDDTDTKGVATPVAEMQRIVGVRPDSHDAIFPFIGGDEVNTSPTHAHHRYVINFGERSEDECRQRWPELMAIVEAKVKPARMKLRDTPDGKRLKARWWQFGRTTPGLFAAITGLQRLLVRSSISEHHALAYVPAGVVVSHNITVFAIESWSAFSVLQCRIHETFAAFFSSGLEDRLGYRPSDCFETFPFPEHWESHPTLQAAGQAYYEFRAAIMAGRSEGLTKTYNRFHDPNEQEPDILKLRGLHDAMDRAVLDAYGWRDLVPACDFLLDYEIDDEEWGDRKKPYRYRWRDDVQAEVLARLLELNADRARIEASAGVAATGKRRRGRLSATAMHSNAELFS